MTEAEAAALAARAATGRDGCGASLARVMEDAERRRGRVAQELALIAVKSDVTEEIDRLRAHVAAARDLLSETARWGAGWISSRRNSTARPTRSAPSRGLAALTRVGLDLKAVIDQMREQVQNVE